MTTYYVEMNYGGVFYSDTVDAETEQEAIEQAATSLYLMFIDNADATEAPEPDDGP